MNIAAIILCAGKGTRMNDTKKSKVCFDCAGTPVIKRIIDNMKQGGVNRFVVVVGYHAENVIDCLSDTENVEFVFQEKQNGTGDAALVGLKALKDSGYRGSAIISMGDKIISSEVISDLIKHSKDCRNIFCVQPLSMNPNGGRIVLDKNSEPCGIVEFADAALASLAGIKPEDYDRKLKETGLNPRKAQKVKEKALKSKPNGKIILNGKTFKAEDVLKTKYTNAGLYCYDVYEAINALNCVSSDNAQGEIYLTDTVEYFAENSEIKLFEINSESSMLTYSTKPELAKISLNFMQNASEMIEKINSGAYDKEFENLYRENSVLQKERYLKLLNAFINTYGDRKIIITRAPGRVNLMGRHIDHRGGGINAMAIDKDTVFVVSPRNDDRVRFCNLDPIFKNGEFSVSEMLSKADHDDWLSYITSDAIKEDVSKNKGSWMNYIKAAILRMQLETDFPLFGMDGAADGNIPIAAGLSSSSSIVVACTEAVVSLNCLNISDDEFIRLCGEGEWYVGSRGGAGDHAAMKCSERDKIVHLNFKPFGVGNHAKFEDRYAVIVANSMIQSKKSEGSKDTFNAKVAAYEFSFMLIRKLFPEYDLKEFRDIAKVRPYSEIYRMIKALPEKATRTEIVNLLPEYSNEINVIFENHAEPPYYELRGVTLFGVSECARSDMFMTLLDKGEYETIGRLMKISHNGDRINNLEITDKMLEDLESENAEIVLQSGKYGCSSEKIDEMCDMVNNADGVLGSELVGAGLGGCVVILAEKEKAQSVLSLLNENYYDKYGYDRSAYICFASCGSSVIY